MEQKYIVAFEIGSSCIKGAIATTAGESGLVNVLAIAEEKLSDKVRYGCVENPSEVAACVSDIARRLQQAHGVSPRLIKTAYVGISGRSVCSIPCTVSREFHAEMEITRRVINDLLEEAGDTPIGDKVVVDIEPVSFSVDSSTTADPVGIFGHSVSAKVNLIACKPKMKSNIDRVFHERSGIRIADYIVTPLAVAEQVLTTEERRLGVMLLDCGAETTTVVIYRGGVMHYLSTIPMGSRNITRDLTSLHCLEERAEEIKKAVGDAMPQVASSRPMVTDGLDYTEINNIVSARADEIISNVFEHISYAGLKSDQLPAGIVLTGGGARLRNFAELLAKQTKLKTRQATVSSAVTLSTHEVSPATALDVISLLAAAATLEPADCTELPAGAVYPVPEYGEYDPYNHETPHPAATSTKERDHDIWTAREDDDADDDDLLSDDKEDDESDIRTSRKAGKEKKEKVKKEKEKKKKSHERSFWNKLGSSIANMMQENSEDDEEE